MFNFSLFRRASSDEKKLDELSNQALSYFNFNGQRIDQLKYDLWESNQKLLDRLYDLRAATGARTPVKVLFMVPDTSLWDVYAPIHRRLSASADFAVRVLAFRRADVEPDKSEDEVIAFFSTRGIDADVEGFGNRPLRQIAAGDADVIFFTLGSVAYPAPYRIEYLSLFCRTCYLPYGFLLADEENYQFGQDFHHSAWSVFASTERELDLYRKYSKRHSTNAVLTGYPKFELLDARLNPVEKPRRPIVIWAPHWAIGLVYPRLNLGTFDRICNEMFELFRSTPQVDFVFKPHPTLLHALVKTTFMDEKAYHTYLSLLEQLPNVSVVKHGDYCNLFLRSSAMITDSVSFLAEYLPTRNPLLFLDRSDRAKLNEVGEKIIALHYHGAGMDSIRAFLGKAIDRGEDPLLEGRMRAGLELLGVTQPASGVICDHLSKSFGLAQPRRSIAQPATSGGADAVPPAETHRPCT